MYNKSDFSARFLFLLLMSMVFPMATLATDVKDFGAKGDGQTDDTDAIRKAIQHAADGLLEFPKGTYRITETLAIELADIGTLGISGKGGSARIVMEGAGPALRIVGSHDKGSALPASVKPVTWEKERMPLVTGLEIVGAHAEADGIALINTFMPVLSGVLIRDVRYGIHLLSRNRNVLIDACHIYHARGVGIYLDDVNIHQMIVSDSHISYCQQGGIKVRGGEIRNFQITGNDIEYNCDPEGEVSADIWVDCSQGGSVREGTIVGNTIQAIHSPDGANIRFTGVPGNADKIGLWSISDNHIGNQAVNIHLDHCRGITVTGNTFMRGYDRHVKIVDSKNILINSNLFDHNDDYYTSQVDAPGGISIDRANHVTLNDNIIDGAGYGNETEGGAVVIANSQMVTVRGSHIYNARYNGIRIAHSTHVQVTDCLIDGKADPEMAAGIVLNGDCAYTVIRQNQVGKGKDGAIVNHAQGVVIEHNQVVSGD